MSQIKNKFIQDASGSTVTGVDGAKFRLQNAQPLRARNAANSADVNILSVNASNVITMAGPLSMGGNLISNVTDPSSAQDAATKNYVDTNFANVTLAAVGSSPNANAASLSGQVLTLQPASGSFPGVVTTGTQTIAGAKTFSTSVSSTFIGANSNPASAGAIRLSNAEYINWRNSTNTVDFGIRLSSTNKFNIDATLLPTNDNLQDLGASSSKFSGVYATSYFGGTFYVDATVGNSNAGVAPSKVGNDGNTYAVSIYADANRRVGVLSTSNANADAVQTGPIGILTGNKTAGTGDSGSILLQTGTSVGGTRGTVQIAPELRMLGSSSGYVGIKAVAAPTSYTVTLPSAQGGAGTILTNDGSGNLSWGSAGGSGTVTSVALAAPSIFTVSGSPVTSSGTLTLSYSGTALPVANGGTNSTAALSNNRVMQSSGGAIVEAAAITASRALISDSNGIPTHSAVTATELGYVSGVTSAIQTQLNAKLNLSGGTMSGAIAMGTNKITGMGDPTAAQDAATKAYVDSVAQGLKPKAAVRVATTVAGTLASSFENGDVIDGVTLATGNRILIKNQSSQSENGIYIVNASGAPTRATDFDSVTPIDEINGAYTLVQFGTVNAGTGWVETATVVTVGTDPIVFQQFTAVTTVIGGDMITVTGGNTISVDLATTSGLESTNPGNAAGQLRAKVDAATVKINGSNQLESLKDNSQNITLNGTDITNQYVDLSFAVYGTSASVNSVVLSVVGGPVQQKTVDYTVSLTGGAGGVTRISFAGDLATGGASALVSGDILMVEYSYLT